MKYAMIMLLASGACVFFGGAVAAQEPLPPDGPAPEIGPPHVGEPRPIHQAPGELRYPRRPRRPDPGPDPDAEVRELLQQVMIARVSQELALNDEQTVMMVRRFSEFRDQMRELMQQRRELIQGLEHMLREGVEGPALEERLGKITGLDMDIAQARLRVFEQASEGLTPWQRAKLYIFVSDFESEMRALVQQAREYRRMRDEGAGPRPPMPPRPEDLRPEGPRPERPRAEGSRPDRPRPERPRPEGPRAEGPRPEGPPPMGPRPEGPWPEGPRPNGPWPEGPRPEAPRAEGPHPPAVRDPQRLPDAPRAPMPQPQP